MMMMKVLGRWVHVAIAGVNSVALPRLLATAVVPAPGVVGVRLHPILVKYSLGVHLGQCEVPIEYGGRTLGRALSIELTYMSLNRSVWSLRWLKLLGRRSHRIPDITLKQQAQARHPPTDSTQHPKR